MSIEQAIQLLRHSRRIVILGNQGAGKTTLAQWLSVATGIRFIDHHWQAGHAGPLPDHRFEAWIIDGDFGFLEHADTVIHLDFPPGLCMYRVIWRALRRAISVRRDPRAALRKAPGALQRLIRRLREVLLHDRETCLRAVPAATRRRASVRITLRTPGELDALMRGLGTGRRGRAMTVPASGGTRRHPSAL